MRPISAPIVAFCLALAGCGQAAPAPVPESAPRPRFPAPDRPVAEITNASWSDEDTRDTSGEAETVFGLLKIGEGMTVADIGAGSGYYTVRLSSRVGENGKVIANDIMPDHLARLRKRVLDQGLSNVSLALGDPGDARLEPRSTDLALMVHMYHEIEDPFGLLWNLHNSLRPGGRVAVIDADRSTARHGTPPALLACEMAAVGFRRTETHKLPGGSYLAVFVPETRPAPEAIRPCRLKEERRLPQPMVSSGRPEPADIPKQ